MGRFRLKAIIESNSIKDLFHLYLSIEYKDESFDDFFVANRAIDDFNKTFQFLIEYVNDNMNLIHEKGAENMCPTGIDAGLFMAFLDSYPITDLVIKGFENCVPSLFDSYGTVHLLGEDND